QKPASQQQTPRNLGIDGAADPLFEHSREQQVLARVAPVMEVAPQLTLSLYTSTSPRDDR
ncbi:hypothetical protein, partial [Enterobacter asburiae]